MSQVQVQKIQEKVQWWKECFFTPKNTKSPWNSRTFVLGCKIVAPLWLPCSWLRQLLMDIEPVTSLKQTSLRSLLRKFPLRENIADIIHFTTSKPWWKRKTTDRLNNRSVAFGSPNWTWTSDTLINSQVLSRAGCFTPTNRAVECNRK